jgi:hypothetical protein
MLHGVGRGKREDEKEGMVEEGKEEEEEMKGKGS